MGLLNRADKGWTVSRERPVRRWIPLAIAGAVLLLIIGITAGSYNGLVNKEEAVDQSFADLDAQLQRRFDLIPGLVEAVRASLRQEQEVFGPIADARSRYAGSSGDERIEAAEELEGALARLLVIVESYPELRSNETIRDFQVQLEGTENRIAIARRDYIEAVRVYNTEITTIPGRFWKVLYPNAKEMATFDIPAEEQQAPKVDFQRRS